MKQKQNSNTKFATICEKAHKAKQFAKTLCETVLTKICENKLTTSLASQGWKSDIEFWVRLNEVKTNCETVLTKICKMFENSSLVCGSDRIADCTHKLTNQREKRKISSAVRHPTIQLRQLIMRLKIKERFLNFAPLTSASQQCNGQQLWEKECLKSDTYASGFLIQNIF